MRPPQSSLHSDLLFSAVESRSEHDLLILGVDNSRRTHTDILWIFSPLVRSVLGSLPSLQDNLLILPDFSSEEIKTALALLQGREGEDLVFDFKTRALLETIGVDLTNTHSQANKMVADEIVELLYSSDEENPPTITGEIPHNEEKEETDGDYEDEGSKSQLVELSDSDDDFDDDEDISYKKEETMESETESPIEETGRKVSVGEEDRKTIHEQKLEEIEELLIFENNQWKCRACQKEFLSKGYLRTHVEIHVSGLSFPCDFCGETFKTRNRLGQHIFRDHKNEKRKRSNRFERKKVTKTITKIKSNPLSKKLNEVEALIEKRNHIWICKVCEKSALTGSALRIHAESHVSGLSYPCQHCGKICSSRNSLSTHKSLKHRKTEKNDNNAAATDDGLGSIIKRNENESLRTKPQKREIPVLSVRSQP